MNRMIQEHNKFQVAIIGGGVSGLTLAVQLADAGYSCVLFERNRYPFHKVCGEYVSMESWHFLERIGLDLTEMKLPQIKEVRVSSPSGHMFSQMHPIGGFGISRYTLDSELAKLAKDKGVQVNDACKVTDLKFDSEVFTIVSEKGIYTSELCVGAWGKQSGLDNKLSRGFLKKQDRTQNYVGIKYHVTLDFPDDIIELHNFKNGYCGMSKIEENKYCLCYLTAAENLKKHGGDIKRMEKEVLYQNPFLKTYFTKSHFLFEKPVAISQIKIGYKSAVEAHVLMLGDTAGNIAPLSGNGMSIAMRSSFFLCQQVERYFKQQISREQLEKRYERFWKSQFRSRIRISGCLQYLLKNTALTNMAIGLFKRIPALGDKVIRATYGSPF